MYGSRIIYCFCSTGDVSGIATPAPTAAGIEEDSIAGANRKRSPGMEEVVARMKELATNRGDAQRRSKRDRASLRATFRSICSTVEVRVDLSKDIVRKSSGSMTFPWILKHSPDCASAGMARQNVC